MFLENVSGYAEQILRNFDISGNDTALIISSSGCNIVPIDMAEIFQKKGVRTVGIISKKHSDASSSKRNDGQKLQDFCDIVLDSGAPVGDAMITIADLETRWRRLNGGSGSYQLCQVSENFTTWQDIPDGTSAAAVWTRKAAFFSGI